MEINGELYLQVQIVTELEKEGSLLQSLSKNATFQEWEIDLTSWQILKTVSTGEEEEKNW